MGPTRGGGREGPAGCSPSCLLEGHPWMSSEPKRGAFGEGAQPPARPSRSADVSGPAGAMHPWGHMGRSVPPSPAGEVCPSAGAWPGTLEADGPCPFTSNSISWNPVKGRSQNSSRRRLKMHRSIVVASLTAKNQPRPKGEVTRAPFTGRKQRSYKYGITVDGRKKPIPAGATGCAGRASSPSPRGSPHSPHVRGGEWRVSTVPV